MLRICRNYGGNTMNGIVRTSFRISRLTVMVTSFAILFAFAVATATPAFAATFYALEIFDQEGDLTPPNVGKCTGPAVATGLPAGTVALHVVEGTVKTITKKSNTVTVYTLGNNTQVYAVSGHTTPPKGTIVESGGSGTGTVLR